MSGLQHFLFCRRQWALIHIENQWADNLRTVDGEILHERAHNEGLTQTRGDVVTTRGMRVFSRRLGVSGQLDVLELHRSAEGIKIRGREGGWLPFPVEYKRGEPKTGQYDEAQLCGQAMCLEDMLCCVIQRGALYYGETRRRTEVEFTQELRSLVRESLMEMHGLMKRGRTPAVKPAKACRACSLKEICLPRLTRMGSVSAYIAHSIEEAP